MRNNRKGFTLAELLIVIAIIAILIGIAIPAFASSLNSARIQTDHANIRSAYAMYQTARINNELDNIGVVSADGTYFFEKDGTLKLLSAADANTYTLQGKVNADDERCASSIGCKNNPTLNITGKHTVGGTISMTYTATGNVWTFTVG